MKKIKKATFLLLVTTFFAAFGIEISALDLLKNINTTFNEFSPSISPDGGYMLFNSQRDGEKYHDIYISYMKQGIWTKPQKFEILNSPYDDETPFISGDGKTIIFSSNRDGSIERKLPNNTIMISYDLYWSHLVNGRWTRPVPVPGNVNTIHHERAPSLNTRNDRLFFSRWDMGKIENAAIFFGVLKNNEFADVYPMPVQINAGQREVALLPDPAGKGFYFSSMRDGGKGGWDIYFISFRDGAFGVPVNLGDDINTPGNEAFFTVVNGRIYYCSDYKDNRKDYDILARHLPGEKFLNFLVVDRQDNPIVTEAEVRKKKAVAESSISSSVHKSDSEGRFSVVLDTKIQSLDIFIEKPGYLPFFKKIPEHELLSPEIKLVLDPIAGGQSFSIESIYFDYNMAKIKPESYVYLDLLADYLRSKSDMKIMIVGHTDLNGSEEANMKLSIERARSVRDYLIKKGIPEDRLEFSGMGKTSPIVNEISDYADPLNRRTEFRILE